MDLELKPGEVHGHGVIRDKDGNIKAEFHFSQPITKDQENVDGSDSQQHG